MSLSSLWLVMTSFQKGVFHKNATCSNNRLRSWRQETPVVNEKSYCPSLEYGIDKSANVHFVGRDETPSCCT